MNSITISRSLVGIFLVAWLAFATASHATDRAPAHGTYIAQVGVLTDDDAVFYGSSTWERDRNCLVTLQTSLSVMVSFQSGRYDVQLLDSRLGRERCCFFEEDNDHLSIEANVKYTQSNLRIRKTDDFVFPARKDIPGETTAKYSSS
jgi:hypothetical protein